MSEFGFKQAYGGEQLETPKKPSPAKKKPAEEEKGSGISPQKLDFGRWDGAY